MQAIVTKYFGPTDHRGSRIKATCQAGSLTLPWDHAMNSEQNHESAAVALAKRLGWFEGGTFRLVGGGMPNGKGYAFVIVEERAKTLGIGLAPREIAAVNDHLASH